MADRDPGDGLGDLRAELDAAFAKELAERLPRMAETVRRLEVALDDPLDEDVPVHVVLDELGRDAHSLKGGAQLVGRSEVGQLAQALEAHVDRAVATGSRPQPNQMRAAIRALGRFDGADRPDRGEIEQLIAGLTAD